MKQRTENPFFTDDQKELIRKDLAEKGLNDFQAEQFIMTCERTLLDPFSRQIYARAQSVNKARGKQADKWVVELIIITGIDGLRAVAERSGEYEGQSATEWYCSDAAHGQPGWQSFWMGVKPQFPEAARVAVYRNGFKEPMVGIARYLSYVQMTKGYRGDANTPAKPTEPTAFWLKMPDVMLAKCAEALALRKAFPMLLAGIFLEEEVRDEAELAETEPGHTGENGQPTAPVTPAAPVTPPGGTSTPETPQTPAGGQAGEPEAAKKTRARKPAATETTAPKEPPTNADVETTGFQNPPAGDGATQGDAGGWQNHVMAEITMQDIAGRKVGDLTADEVKRLKEKWVDKYATKIALNAAKKKEADAILEAFDFHFPKK